MQHTKTNNLLVLTSWAPPMVGGPLSLYNLFLQLAEYQYLIITSSVVLRESHTRAQYFLDGEYFFFDTFSSALGRDLKTQSAKTVQGKGVARTPKTDARLQRLDQKPIMRSILTIVKICVMTTVGIFFSLKRRSKIIIGISDYGPSLIAAYITSLLTRKKLILLLYDLYKGNNLTPFEKLLAEFFEPKLLRHAKKVFVTNDSTRDYYAKQYPTLSQCVVMYNAVFPEKYKDTLPYNPLPPYHIIFTGHVYWAQQQAVLNMIEAMRYLQDLPLFFDLYIPSENREITEAIAKAKNISIASAPQSEMPRIQSEATLLFLPLAWNTHAPDIVATATPGKFTDYLAAGRPMLVHAPPYAYISQYTKKNDLGLVVDQNDVQMLVAVIRHFLRHTDDGRRYITNAQHTFRKNHDARRNAQIFIQNLSEVEPSCIQFNETFS